MIHFVTYLNDEHWRLSVYVIEECGEGREIIEDLVDMGCRGVELADAIGEIDRCGMNIGITYSVADRRNSLMMIGLQKDVSEFVNTLRHEQHHVIAHICEADGIDMASEDAAYIAGDVGQVIYDKMSSIGLV